MTSNKRWRPLLRDKSCPSSPWCAIIALWYAAAVFLNAPFERDQAQRAGTTISFSEILPRTMAQERPVLPAPHQVFAESGTPPSARRSPRSAAWSTTLDHAVLDAARLPMGTLLGILLAVGIVHSSA
jgi:NitT/TauT family transport system permease protein